MIDAEQWRYVVGFEGWYEVSDLGRVRRVRRGQGARMGVLKPHLRGSHARVKYASVSLYRDGCRVEPSVHSLVLHAFTGPRPPGMEGCHDDCDSLNNRHTNLRWGTRPDNRKDSIRHGTLRYGSRHPYAKANEVDVERIRDLGAAGCSSSEIASWIGLLTPRSVRHILHGKNWKQTL